MHVCRCQQSTPIQNPPRWLRCDDTGTPFIHETSPSFTHVAHEVMRTTLGSFSFVFLFFLQSLLWINKRLPTEAQAGEAASVSRWSVRLKTISQSVGETLGCCVTELDSSTRFLNGKWAWTYTNKPHPFLWHPFGRNHTRQIIILTRWAIHTLFSLSLGDVSSFLCLTTLVWRQLSWLFAVVKFGLCFPSVNRSRLDVSQAALSALDTRLFESQLWPSEGTAWFRSH